mgnify:CR=1 FL=1
MSEYQVPIDYNRARNVLRRLNAYAHYSPEGAAQALDVLRQAYPLTFARLEQKSFERDAVLLEMPGAKATGPLVFVSHLDAPARNACEDKAPAHAQAMCVALSRAHVVALLEALEGLLNEGYHPGGDLMLALSMDGLSEGLGASSLASHLKARSVEPCFVLDHGGYATMEAFRTYLPRESPLALVGIGEKGRLHARLTLEDGEGTLRQLMRAGAKLTRRQTRVSLCAASVQMLQALGARAPLLQRWFVRNPKATFPIMRLMWRKRAVLRQFFASQRCIDGVQAQATPERAEGTLHLRQTLMPGLRCAQARRQVRRVAARCGLSVRFCVAEDACARSKPDGEAWEALKTAIEIQFERSVVVPCLSPFATDARHYAGLCRRVYRFSPFLLTGSEALRGVCTVTDGSLQTAVQFFRSMLCV